MNYYRRSPSGKLLQVHWPFVTLVAAMAAFGVAMLYSAAGGHMEPWAGRQAIRFLVAFIVMMLLAMTPNRWLMRYAYLAYFGCFGLLLMVEAIGFIGMGAQRWLSVGMVNVQPSELMKLALVLAMARYYHGIHPEDVSRPLFLLPPLAMIGLPVALILHQPNLGTATITAGVGGLILLAAGVNLRYFIVVILLGIAAVPLGWQFLHDYQKQRVMTFLNPESDPLGAGYNIMQSQIAIGSGGIGGKGFLQGSQGQLDFLPEKHTDFIFTMVAEEFGFIGGVTTISFFLLIIAFGLATAMRSRSHFGALVAIGITAIVLLHITINIGMVMGLLPVVGVPLPLLSYGGTMAFSMMIGFGLLLNSYVHRDVAVGKAGLTAW